MIIIIRFLFSKIVISNPSNRGKNGKDLTGFISFPSYLLLSLTSFRLGATHEYRTFCLKENYSVNDSYVVITFNSKKYDSKMVSR